MADKLEDVVKERIKFYTEIMKLVVALFAGTLGGSFALLSKDSLSTRDIVLVVSGFIFAVFFGIIANWLFKLIRGYIDPKPDGNR